MSIFDCILNDLDESVYYVHQVELNSDYDDPIIDSMETMTFPCVKALKIVNDEELVESTETKYQFKALFPNLQHLSLENIEVGEYYLNDMVASFAEGLQTLMVSVYKPAGMIWLLKTLPRLKKLKVLHLKEWYCKNEGISPYEPAVNEPTHLGHLYLKKGSKYNKLF